MAPTTKEEFDEFAQLLVRRIQRHEVSGIK
jgi:hypothetical protein